MSLARLRSLGLLGPTIGGVLTPQTVGIGEKRPAEFVRQQGALRRKRARAAKAKKRWDAQKLNEWFMRKANLLVRSEPKRGQSKTQRIMANIPQKLQLDQMGLTREQFIQRLSDAMDRLGPGSPDPEVTLQTPRQRRADEPETPRN